LIILLRGTQALTSGSKGSAAYPIIGLKSAPLLTLILEVVRSHHHHHYPRNILKYRTTSNIIYIQLTLFYFLYMIELIDRSS